MNDNQDRNDFIDAAAELYDEYVTRVALVAPDAVGKELAGHPDVLRQAVTYSARTGHRLVITYRNLRGRRTVDRKVVAGKVTQKGTAFRAFDLDLREYRTFRFDRIETARLDG